LIGHCPAGEKMNQLSHFEFRPKDLRPLSDYNENDAQKILSEIANEIHKLITKEPLIPTPGNSTDQSNKRNKATSFKNIAINIDINDLKTGFNNFVEQFRQLPKILVENLQNENYATIRKQLPLNFYKDNKNDLKQLPLLILSHLDEEGFLNISPQKQQDDHFYFYAKKFGIGYESFNVKCNIDDDGSESVIRTVELNAYSPISDLDIAIKIRERDPDGNFREIREGKIQPLDDHKLTLTSVVHNSGGMTAKISISPSLKPGDNLQYKIYNYHLPPKTYAINLPNDEFIKRIDPHDYFGWNITRPTKNFILEIQFPFNTCPHEYWHEVSLASSMAVSSEEKHLLEKQRISPSNDSMRFPDLIKLEVDYPLYGLVYSLGWNPIILNTV
jgi:hypothetical protein